MQEDLSNIHASVGMCFDSGIPRDEFQSKKIRGEVDMFILSRKELTASSFARQKEMIELKLKQTKLHLELELAQEQGERIWKEAEFQRLEHEIELERKRITNRATGVISDVIWWFQFEM